jgi:hypothetical protein
MTDDLLGDDYLEFLEAAQAEAEPLRETIEEDDEPDSHGEARRTACLTWATIFMEGDA